MEIALRLDVLDEQWLRRKLGGKPDSYEWVVGYLRDHYRIAERAKENRPDTTTYHWVGREVDGAHVWWYFEIEPKDKSRPSWIEVRVLLEREKNYTHQILQLDTKPRRSMTLSAERPRGELDSRDEQTGDGRNLQSKPRQRTADR